MLVRNVGIRGKHKLADRWEHKPYIVKDKPNPDIPVYVVQEEGSRKKPRILHRNLLLPFMGLPCMEKSELSNQSSVSEDQLPLVPTAINADTGHKGPLVLSSDEDSEIGSEAGTQSLSGYEASSDAESLPVDSPGKYIIPARRQSRLPVGDQQLSSSTSCSSEETNRPRRPQRARKKPSWMADKNWMVG